MSPTIYLLYGDDDYGKRAFVQALLEKLGDPATAEMNTSRLEGRAFSLASLEQAAMAAPFLGDRRVVICEGVLGSLRAAEDRQRFLALLERIPPFTAVVLLEGELEPAAKKKETPWMLKWAASQPERVFAREFSIPQGRALAQWIRTQARERGGAFTPEAASHLAALVADDNRMAVSEMDKLLAYVNYQRPVEADDVELLTPSVQTGDVFKMVDAIGNRQGKLALKLLRQQLSERDPLSLLGMITRQFRLLLLAKELLAGNANSNEIARTLRVQDFVVRKLISQSRNFERPALEEIYRKLAEVDETIKTGKMEAETALETLVVALTL